MSAWMGSDAAGTRMLHIGIGVIVVVMALIAGLAVSGWVAIISAAMKRNRPVRCVCAINCFCLHCRFRS